MAIDFHDPKNKHVYSSRKVNKDWVNFFLNFMKRNNRHAVDIGCGGGIYSKALFEAGFPNVTGIDYSKTMIEAAKIYCKAYSKINFTVGNAYNTGLKNHACDFVFERALIHHLNDLSACFSEAFRLLEPGGTIFIQDRTLEDCLHRGTSRHIRGYFFELFPHLQVFERKRRHTGEAVMHALHNAGFTVVKEIKYWEIRQKYTTKKELLTDISRKTGRSILHELTNHQLYRLVAFIDQRLPHTGEIIEEDRWTIWTANKEIQGDK